MITKHGIQSKIKIMINTKGYNCFILANKQKTD